jgi:polyhydroxyalkanoate synthesis regulator phasin
MENKIIAKQLIEFQKASFDNTFNSLAVLHEQTEKMVQTFIQQATWLPNEGKEAIKEWVNIYKKGRIDFKAAADKNYKKVEEYFNAGDVAPKTKSSKK